VTIRDDDDDHSVTPRTTRSSGLPPRPTPTLTGDAAIIEAVLDEFSPPSSPSKGARKKQFRTQSTLAAEHKLKAVAQDDYLEAFRNKYEVSRRERDMKIRLEQVCN
jgi:hypothetical protein